MALFRFMGRPCISIIYLFNRSGSSFTLTIRFFFSSASLLTCSSISSCCVFHLVYIKYKCHKCSSTLFIIARQSSTYIKVNFLTHSVSTLSIPTTGQTSRAHFQAEWQNTNPNGEITKFISLLQCLQVYFLVSLHISKMCQ